MNQQKLTQRDLEKKRRRSTLQILLLVLFTPLLAMPGLGQETNPVKDQCENSTLSDDSQVQVQPKTKPVINLDLLRIEEQTKDKNQPNQKLFAVAANATERSSASTIQAGPDLSNFAVFGDFGVAIPHGDFSDFFDPGFSLNAGVEFMITSQFSAEGIFGYHRFGTFFGGSVDFFQLSANGKFYLVDESSRVRPFVKGGIGAYVSNSGTARFGGNVGGGVLFEVTPRVGIQGSYNFHAVNTDPNLRFSTVQGGVRFRF